MKIQVNEIYQKGYTYELTEQPGKNFDHDFQPDLTPKQMLELGIFGGIYFTAIPKEFPKDWFTNAKIASSSETQKELNYFGINASQPYEVWKQKGWIHKDDPLGWVLWYFRYYLGRRHPDDIRQIRRWKAYRRHLAQVSQNCESGDMHCRPKQRQSLLHWAYDSRKI